MSKLLIETRLFEGKVNEDSSGRTIVKGILQRAGAPNQNERVYPKEIHPIKSFKETQDDLHQK